MTQPSPAGQLSAAPETSSAKQVAAVAVMTEVDLLIAFLRNRCLELAGDLHAARELISHQQMAIAQLQQASTDKAK